MNNVMKNLQNLGKAVQTPQLSYQLQNFTWIWILNNRSHRSLWNF